MTLPETPRERTEWILSLRGAKNPLTPYAPYAALWEEEAGANGSLVSTATLFLSNKECPFRCLMCDLWRNTLDERVPKGAIPAQIRAALSQLPPAKQIKLYNAGSFFDPQAIPPEDYPAIAELLTPFERVIVECHPAFIGERLRVFQSLLVAKLEVAIGLETAHPGVLERLNKRVTLAQFQESARFLAEQGADLRVFILLRPPFLSEEEGLHWALRSLDFAFDCGASVCCVIPVRDGNGAMEALRESGEYAPPKIKTLETAIEYGIGLGKGRVFADLWDIERFAGCKCATRRIARLEAINASQSLPAPIACDVCEREDALAG